MRNYEIEKEMYRRAVELRKLQPYHWTTAYPAEGLVLQDEKIWKEVILLFNMSIGL